MRHSLLRHSFLAVVFLALSTFAAHADTTFNVSGATEHNGTFSGTITLDTATSQFTAASITYSLFSSTYLFNVIDLQELGGGTYNTYIADAAGEQFALKLPVATLSGYQGSTICTGNCLTPGGGYASAFFDMLNPRDLYNVTSGSLTPAAATPEPSSIALLTTGLLGIAGTLRKRRA